MNPNLNTRDELAALEGRLATWSPADPSGRDAMLFQAGRRSASRDARIRELLMLSVSLPLALGVWITRERLHSQSINQRLAERKPHSWPSAMPIFPPAPAATPDPASYRVLVHQILTEGIDLAPARDRPLDVSRPDQPPPLRVRDVHKLSG